jgi:hypothetical protein
MRTIVILLVAYLLTGIFRVSCNLIFDSKLTYLRIPYMLFLILLLWPVVLLREVSAIITNYRSTGDDFGDYLLIISESYVTPREEMLPGFLSKSVPAIIFFTAIVAVGFWISN